MGQIHEKANDDHRLGRVPGHETLLQLSSSERKEIKNFQRRIKSESKLQVSLIKLYSTSNPPSQLIMLKLHSIFVYFQHKMQMNFLQCAYLLFIHLCE